MESIPSALFLSHVFPSAAPADVCCSDDFLLFSEIFFTASFTSAASVKNASTFMIGLVTQLHTFTMHWAIFTFASVRQSFNDSIIDFKSFSV